MSQSRYSVMFRALLVATMLVTVASCTEQWPEARQGSTQSAGAQSRQPNCVGLGCDRKECIGLGCQGEKCIGMGCEKEQAAPK